VLITLDQAKKWNFITKVLLTPKVLKMLGSQTRGEGAKGRKKNKSGTKSRSGHE